MKRTNSLWVHALMRRSRQWQRAAVKRLPPPQLPGKWMASHFTWAEAPAALPRRLSYWLYVPQRAEGPLPLIVMLHGCEQTAPQFAQGTRMNALAEREGFAVLYPQQSASAHPRRCWLWYDKATQQGGGEVPALAGLVREVMRRYPVDPARVYIGGLSAGAAMAHIVALNHPELFAGIGLHSGPLFGVAQGSIGALSVMRHGGEHRMFEAVEEVLARRPGFPPLPAILIQGTGDTVVAPVNQQQLARQLLRLNRLPDSARTAVRRKDASQRTLGYQLHDVYAGRKLMVRVASVDQLPHAWSGGDARLAFNHAAGPNASRMMVDFFKRHRRVH
jgi:poly(hydroxyalkanoate) depolymerase family esterase